MKLNKRDLFGFIAGALVCAASPTAGASPNSTIPDLINKIKELMGSAANYALFQPNDAFIRYQMINFLNQNLDSLKK